MLGPLIVILSKDFSESGAKRSVPLFRKSAPQLKKPAWSYTVKGAIWRIHSTTTGTLMGEERRTDDKKAIFFCLNRENGGELWRKSLPGDEWWIGIEAVCGDTVLFHGFATPDLPLHRGIIVADVRSGEILWEDRQLEFVGASGDSIFGSTETSAGRAFVELDRRSGLLLRNVDPAELPALHQTLSHQAANAMEGESPLPLEHLVAEDPEIGSIVSDHCSERTVTGSIEAVATKNFVIFDHHDVSDRGTPQERLFSATIKVIDRRTGGLVYSDTVSGDLHSVIPELFLVRQDMLYYIKERRTLIAVHLAS